MIRLNSFSFSLAAVCVVSGVVISTRAAEEKVSVEKFLQAKDFYETSGARKFTNDEIKQLAELAAKSTDDKLRVRAQKILVEQAGKSRGSDVEAVSASFKYLEQKLGDPQVRKLLIEQGFTHYTLAEKRADDSQFFLIEHVSTAKGFNGGLNLRYDRKKKSIVEIKSWGGVVIDNAAERK